MTKAILKVLKNATITAFPNGQNTVVDIVCGGVKADLQQVIVDSAFVEYDRFAPGRVVAIKINCGVETSYALGNLTDLLNLQNCCVILKNYKIGMGCVPGESVTVYNVLGNEIGTASTPTQYASIWNANATNRVIGTLYIENGWNFNLSFRIGNERPLIFPCVGDGGSYVYLCPNNLVVSSTGYGNLHVAFEALVARAYVIRVYSNEAATALVASYTYTNTSGATQNATHDFNGLAAGNYYAEVREAGSATVCTIASAAVAVAPSGGGGGGGSVVEWNFFDNEPASDGLDAYDYPNSQAHVAEADISINVAAMGSNRWIVARYPDSESNYTKWYNTAQNNGNIPDSAFLDIITMSGHKYVKSRTALTFDPASPFKITH